MSLIGLGAALAAAGVVLGAFGAHALRGTLGPQALGWWETAVQYQMWHAVGLIALGAAPARSFEAPGVVLAIGTSLFSGSLYLMALTGMRWPGMVAPVGGLMMIGGWVWVVWSVRGKE